MNHPIGIKLPTPFGVGPVNTYLLSGDEPTLIDTGPRTKEARAALASGLAGQGLTPRPAVALHHSRALSAGW